MMYCKIADLLVALEAGGRTARQAEPYRVSACPGPPDIELVCDPARVMADNPWITDLDLAEYMGTGAAFARRLLDFSGFQLHASAVELGGKAYLFSGPCGIGKSTHAEKWARLFGASFLNDDKPALRRLNGHWMAYGTPWSGKHDLSRPAGVEMGAVLFLKQGEENQVEPLKPAEALPLFLSQTPRALLWDGMERLLGLADQFLREVDLWRLTCRNDDAAALLAHGTACGKEPIR